MNKKTNIGTAAANLLSNFFTNGYIYKVPEYQRKYTWTTDKQLKIFWEDITSLFWQNYENSSNNSYFFGTIISMNKNNEQLLIDGQQRITTFLLFFKALYDHISQDEKFDDKSNALSVLKGKIYWTETGDKSQRLKITHINNEDLFKNIFSELDDTNFEKLLKNKNTFVKKSIYHKNYFYLREKIYGLSSKLSQDKYDKNIFDFYEKVMDKIWVVKIELGNNDDELAIFESINSKGAKLSVVDLIKNFLYIKTRDFQSGPVDYNNKILTFFTKDIYNNFNFLKKDANEKEQEKQLIDFFRTYIIYSLSTMEKGSNTIKLPPANKPEELYNIFKIIFKEKYNNLRNPSDFDDFFKDINQKLYIQDYIYNKSNTSNKMTKLSLVLSLMYKEISGSQLLPLLFQISDDIFEIHSTQDTHHIESNEKFQKTILFMEEFYTKRNICGMGSRLLTRSVNQIRVNTLDELKSQLLEVKDWMPNDTIFEQFLRANMLFSNSKPQLKMVLWRIEFERNKNSNETVSPVTIKNSSLEHIMPQTLENLEKASVKNWLNSLSSNEYEAKNIHEELKHNIGNITITGDNSKLSDGSFEEKKKLYSKSRISLNTELSDCEIWNRESIEQRQEKIISEIMELYK